MDNSRQKVISNLIWRFMERCGSQVISFVVSVVLARLLAPELYGSIALVTVITSVLQVFVDSGMANALIQKKDTDDLDYSSVFYFNLVFCLILYIGLFFAAPLISRIYKDMSLVPVIRVLGLTLVVSGVKNVQQAYVSKTMQFRRFFFNQQLHGVFDFQLTRFLLLAAQVLEHGLQLAGHLFHSRRRHNFNAHRCGCEIDLNFFIVELAFTQFFAECLTSSGRFLLLFGLSPVVFSRWDQHVENTFFCQFSFQFFDSGI